MTAYAISMDEIEEDDLSIFDIFDEIDSDQTEAGYAIEKYLEKNFDSLHSKYFDGLKRCVLYIGTVYVNPEYRHNGIAQFLFENYQLILSRYGIIPILSSYRRLNRQRSVFPSSQALLKALYLATFEATKNWTMTLRNWGKVYGELSIMYPGRLPE